MPLFEVKFILVRPRDPNNIGAAARALKNFGFRELAVVAPYPPIWSEIVSAVNAEDVVRDARVFATLAEAVADCTLVVGTGDHTRLADGQSAYAPRDLVTDLNATGHRLALVFGSEKHGLTKNEMAHCHRLMSIPTRPECPSMNLGQAVAVCCYELTRAESAIEAVAPARPYATVGQLEISLQLLMEVLREAQFVMPANDDLLTRRLRQQLLQLELTPRDVHLLCGVLRQIQWRFENK
jgi:tRNA/rRNA methyltransferase